MNDGAEFEQSSARAPAVTKLLGFYVIAKEHRALAGAGVLVA